MSGASAPVVVVGQVGRDLVLQVDALPGPGGSTPVRGRRELLGGKGANQALALVQLGRPAALVGVLGDDPAGDLVLAQAAGDGIDVGAVVRRPGASTALLVDVVEPHGVRRLLEDVAEAVLLSADDVTAAGPLLGRAGAVVLQLQQPGPAIDRALELRAAGVLTVADGAPPDGRTGQVLLDRVDVLRADATEAAAWVGRELAGPDDARAAALELVDRGPRVVSLAAGGAGDLTAWRGPDGTRGTQLVPHLDDDPADPTGGGDAVVAALTVALLRGAHPRAAAWEAAAAASLTVTRVGGRPALRAEEVTRRADQAAGRTTGEP